MNAILILERIRCWNRHGCLFPSDKKSIVNTMLPFAKNIILQQFIDSLMKHPPEMEEGYEDLWLTAENAPRIIRLYNKNNNEIKSIRDDNVNSIVIEYGEDDGCDSPVLVETYTIREIRTSWYFVADEEFHHYFIPYIQAGILTDGQRFLYWNVTEDKYGRPTCHIHNSIRMDSDTEEVYYPWTSANNAKVIDALNNPAAGDNWSGEASVLLDIEFDEPEYKYSIDQIQAGGILKALS